MTTRIGFHLVAVGALALFAMPAGTARAGGLEYTGQGAQSLARGGAVAARADDPMVLAHNPAGLAELRGTQFLLNVNLPLMDACVDPSGFYGWGVYNGGARETDTGLVDPETGEVEVIELGDIDPTGTFAVEDDYYADPYDTVCLDQNIVPIPQLAVTHRVSEAFGIGFGFIFPSVAPGGRWGNENGTIRGDDGELRPTPTRYMGLYSSNIAVFPTLGAGLRLMDELRLGLAVEWGVIAVNTTTMAASTGGTVPAGDIIAHVKAQDFFVPAATASVHLVPVDAIDVVFAFRWQDDLEADGDVDLTTGFANANGLPYINEHIPILSLTQHMPWKLRGGVRYAHRLAPRPTGTGSGEGDPAGQEPVHDAMQDELWDVELDVEYQLNSRNDAQVLVYEPNNQVAFRFADPTSTSDPIIFPNPADPDTRIEKYWEDQVSLRLGGSLNVLPGVVGVMAGAHYENRGVDPSFMQTDFWPVQRIGLHGGVKFRVAGSLDLVFAYAHIFQETIIVAAPEQRAASDIYTEWAASPPPKTVNGIDKTVGVPLDRTGKGTFVAEEASQGEPDGVAMLDQNVSRSLNNQPPIIINAGRYRSGMDVLAVGATLHF